MREHTLILCHKTTAFRLAGFILINMVKKPGYDRFVSEVTWSLMYFQGVVLLFDATQGVQYQITIRQGEWALG